MRLETLCWCDKKLVDVQSASFVTLINGIVRPLCSHACWERFQERCELKADLQRREWATREVRDLRRVPFADEEGASRRAEMRRLEAREIL